MKKILITLLAATTLFVACNKEDEKISTGVGEITLSVKCGEDDYTDRLVVKSASNVDVNTFLVTLTKIEDEFAASVEDWTREWTVGEFPKALELSPGRYNIVVVSPTIDRVTTVRPSYKAEQEFTIVEDVVTPLELVCQITNMKVSMAPTQNFFDQLASYTITVNAEYEGLATPLSVQWTHADFHLNEAGDMVTDKVAYVDVPDSLSIMVTGIRSLDGSDAQLSEPYVIKSCAAKDHHIVNVDVQIVGELSTMSITLDSSLNNTLADVSVEGFEEIPVEDEGDDQGQDISAPYMIWEKNPTFKKMTITDDIEVNIDIFATKKIKDFVVRVSDNFKMYVQVLTELDPETGKNKDYMDLINDKELASKLQDDLYLPTGDEIYEKKYVFFPLSSLVPLVKTVVKGEDVDFILQQSWNELTNSHNSGNINTTA